MVELFMQLSIGFHYHSLLKGRETGNLSLKGGEKAGFLT